jgi:hypothetical protein
LAIAIAAATTAAAASTTRGQLLLSGFQHRIGIIARTHNSGDDVVEIVWGGISQQRWIKAEPTEYQLLA